MPLHVREQHFDSSPHSWNSTASSTDTEGSAIRLRSVAVDIGHTHSPLSSNGTDDSNSDATRHLPDTVRHATHRYLAPVSTHVQTPPWLPPVVQRHQFAPNDTAHVAFDYLLNIGYEELLWLSGASDAAAAGMSFGIISSSTDPAWFNIMAAVGGAQAAAIPVMHPTMTQPVDPAKYDIALQLFSRAAAASRGLQARIHHFTMLETLLESFLMLFAFELAVGNHMSCLRYLRYFRAVCQAHPEWTLKVIAPGRPLSRAMAGNIRGLADTSMPHRVEFTPINTTDRGDSLGFLLARTTSSVPHDFTSVDEASSYLECLLDAKREIELSVFRSADKHVQSLLQKRPALDRRLTVSQQQCLKFCVGRIIHLDTRILGKIDETLRGLVSWEAKFAALMKAQSHCVAAIPFLQVQAFCVLFALATCRQTEELACDRFAADFQRTIVLAEQYLNSRTRNSGNQAGPHPVSAHTSTSIFEWGILRTLYFICVKCRDPAVRRKACRLLSGVKRREGNIESERLAKYAQSVIALEEQKAGHLSREAFVLRGLFADRVPEMARYSEIAVPTRHDATDSFDIVCGRFAHERDGQIELAEYTCYPGADWGQVLQDGVVVSVLSPTETSLNPRQEAEEYLSGFLGAPVADSARDPFTKSSFLSF